MGAQAVLAQDFGSTPNLLLSDPSGNEVMNHFALSLCVFSLSLANVLSTKTGVTPIQKVIEMMDSMLAKGKQEKHEEEVEFAKFHEWCDQVRDEKTKSIKEATTE